MRLDLIVTHGIFSKGTKELARYYNQIFTSDSWCELNGNDFNVLNVFGVFDRIKEAK